LRAFLGDFIFVELPQVSSIVETYGTDGFVRVELPYKIYNLVDRTYRFCAIIVRSTGDIVITYKAGT